MERYPVIGLLVLALAGAGACAQPEPTPDIHETVAAGVRATVEALDGQPSSSALPIKTADSIVSSQAPTPLTPTATPRATVRLREQLPRDVFEQFESDFYAGCTDPPFDELNVAKAWSGDGSDTLRFTPPTGSYFLALVGSPSGQTWVFDSVVRDLHGRRWQSLQINSSLADDVINAQQWCSSGFGVSPQITLEIKATNLEWSVYLVTVGGTVPLPETVVAALEGYYGGCPPIPPMGDLEATMLGDGIGAATLPFEATPPTSFLGVRFEPDSDEWFFGSSNVSRNSSLTGPRVSSQSGERIAFTSMCPASKSSRHLEIEADGGRWIVYLIASHQR